MLPINKSGFTLLEAIISAAMAGIVIMVLVLFFSKNNTAMQRTRVRQEVILDSRSAMDNIIDRLHNGKAASMNISTPSNAVFVPYSRADFELQVPLPDGATAYAIYLDPATNTLYTEEFGVLASNHVTVLAPEPRVLANHVTSLMFTGDSNDPGIVSVSLRMDIPYDATGNPAHVSTIVVPDTIARMVETQ